MLTELTSNELTVVNSNRDLQRYLESLLHGRPMTPRSWLYENVTDPDQILRNWMLHLDTLKKGSEFEQEVYQFDTLQTAKWGPQGGIKPISELKDIVMSGFGESPTPKAFDSDAWKTAKEAVTVTLFSLGCKNLRPASYSRVVDDMRARDTLESNSGWPLFSRRNKTEVISQSIADAESGKWKEYPAIALFRNYNQKTRLVWMFPMSANIVEGSFFQVMQSTLIKANTRFLAPWTGFETVRCVVTNCYDPSVRWYVGASDFSNTDAHFHFSATGQVADVIEKCFQPRYRAALRDSLERMNTIPLVVGPTQKLVGNHGVSSGSNWTNFVETIFDWILSFYVLLKTSARTEPRALKQAIAYGAQGIYVPNSKAHQGLYAIGDDMTWITGVYDEEFAEKLERFGKDVGMEIKAEKTTNDRNKVVSLQRLFIRGYSRPDGKIRAVYPTIRALKSSVFPERFHRPKDWSSDMFCARQYMILENCVDHPLFEEFVKFVVKGQRDLIPFAKKSRAELDRILRETKLLPGLNPTYNQERRDQSLADFESIRIASKL